MIPLSGHEATLLEAAVVNDRLDALPHELLLRSGLASRTYAAGTAAGAPGVVAAFASASIQHQRARDALLPLLEACRRAGVPVLVFKGYHLAEWVYAHPAQRPYGDVDVLIDPAHARAVGEAAAGLGWTVAWSREGGSLRFEHAELQLVSPSGDTHVDVHRFAAPCASPFDAVQRRVTRLVWAEAREARLEGVPVRVPSPEDAALVGLALNRFWSPDGLAAKPHDYFDLRALRDRYGWSRSDLDARARALGCADTWRIFRGRCDPWKGRLRLVPPALPARQWYLARIGLERPHPHVEDALMRWVRRGAGRRAAGTTP